MPKSVLIFKHVAIAPILFFIIIACFSPSSLGRTPFAFLRTKARPIATGGSNGYFVATPTTYDGNRGGLAGANSTCLTVLTDNDWLGKSSAGSLTADRVKAWLCDNSTCQDLAANTTFYFALAGSTTVGGDSFTTDAAGLGPGNSNAWNTSTTFGSSISIWTGRAVGAATLWPSTAQGTSCTNWSSNAMGSKGRVGNALSTGTARWSHSDTGCASGYNLVCFVNP